jgi:hypothetical protein
MTKCNNLIGAQDSYTRSLGCEYSLHLDGGEPCVEGSIEWHMMARVPFSITLVVGSMAKMKVSSGKSQALTSLGDVTLATFAGLNINSDGSEPIAWNTAPLNTNYVLVAEQQRCQAAPFRGVQLDLPQGLATYN